MGTASTNPQESQSMVKFPGPQAARVMTQTSGSYSLPSNFAAFEDMAGKFLKSFLERSVFSANFTAASLISF